MSTKTVMTHSRIFPALVAAFFIMLISSPARGQQPALLLFGDDDHKTFLGCLNCGRFETNSVCNRFGEYGSRFSEKSIWNRFGEFGSKVSDKSPWNKFATNPPVIVDGDGNSYGYFTSSRYHTSRTRNEFFLVFLDRPDDVNEDLQRASDLFCGRD